MKWAEGWFDRRATTWLARGLHTAERHYDILRGGFTGGSSAPQLLNPMIRVAQGAARDATGKLDDELLVVWRDDLKSAEKRAGLEREKLENRIAHLEQFHCEHEFSEVKKGCLESLFCAKCGAVNPGWCKMELPIDLPERDWVEWENTGRGWRPRDKRAIYVLNDGHYVPVAPPEEAP